MNKIHAHLFDNQYVLSGYTVLDTTPFLYTHIQRAKPQKKVEALRMKIKLTVSMEMHVRENQNWLGQTEILTGQESPCEDQKIICINRG